MGQLLAFWLLISPCYEPFWLGARFENYVTVISLSFNPFIGRRLTANY
jgi:hypothetical protein